MHARAIVLKSHIKETNKRVIYKSPEKETYNRAIKETITDTYTRAIHKRHTHEPSKRDLQKRVLVTPKVMNFSSWRQNMESCNKTVLDPYTF